MPHLVEGCDWPVLYGSARVYDFAVKTGAQMERLEKKSARRACRKYLRSTLDALMRGGETYIAVGKRLTERQLPRGLGVVGPIDFVVS
jgi:hypothetical protein